MRKILLTTTAVVSIATLAPAQEGGPLQGAIEGRLEMLNAQGANITYDSREVGSDDSLTYTGLRMAPDNERLELSTDWVRFTPAADMDGGVTVTVAPVVSLSLRDEADMAVDLDVESEDFALTTNLLLGGMNAPRLEMSAARFAATGGGQVEDGTQEIDVQGEGIEMSFAFDMATQGGTATATMGKVQGDIGLIGPDGARKMSMQISQDSSHMEFSGEGLPLSGDEAALSAFLAGGGRASLSIESGPSSTVMGPTAADMPFGMESSSEGGTMALSVADGVFNYTAQAGATRYAISPNPQVMPLPPMDAALDGLEMVVQAPVTPTETPKQAKLVINLRNLDISDSAWGLIDPEGTLPRDPATLEIDLSSMLRLLMPLGEVEGTGNPGETAEVDSLDIDRLHLDAAGAELDADGALTMDNSGPFPMPSGTINISLRGAQTLAEKLVALGLLDQMQVGMVMGMMMAFAEQGDGPDHYTSTIEFNDDGVFANGQPIQ